MSETNAWWAKGLIFENCSCQLVCPGHMHFEQLCTHERCRGYWAFRFDGGDIEGLALEGRRAVVAFDAPQRMIDGQWTQILLLDDATSDAQRRCMEKLFFGQIGGPWEILARFVETRLETRQVPIEFEESETSKRVSIRGLLESTIQTIRGRDRTTPVRFENIFNQIHDASQVLALGDAKYDDPTIGFDNKSTHGLWSNFSWTVEAAG